MLREGHFLRNLPTAINLETRLRFETIGFSLDGMMYSYRSMLECCLSIADDVLKIGHHPSDDKRVALFNHAWSFIDQAHMLRSLTKALNKGLESPLKKFEDNQVNASYLRNYMDHIGQNFSNLTKSKKRRPPLIGSIIFRHFDIQSVKCIGNGNFSYRRYHSIVVNAGSNTHNHATRILGTDARLSFEYPIGFLEFSAYDFHLDISRAILDAFLVADRFDTHVRQMFETAITQAAVQKGLIPTDLTNTFGNSYVIVADAHVVDSDYEEINQINSKRAEIIYLIIKKFGL